MRLPDPGGSRIVLVGWTRYDRADLTDLPAVSGNLSALSATFADARFATIPPARVSVLVDQSRPHDAGIEITGAANQASDLLLLYFAGHLQLGPGAEPQFPLTATDAYARPSALSLNWVAQCLAQSNALNKILIIDARLACAEEEVAGFGKALVMLCEQIPGVSTWIYGSADENLYTQPGTTATAMTGALLESVHRVETRESELDLVRLHEYTAHVMRRGLMPTPRLYLCDQARIALGSPPGWVALFGGSPAGPSGADVALMRSLRAAATDAERNFYLPAEAADTYRALVMSSQRVLGPDHVETLRARQRLARWIGQSGDAKAAAREYQRLYEDQRRVLGVDHSDTVGTDNDIRYWSQR